MGIEAVIFDLDGVIVDSNHAIFETYQQTARELGETIPTDEDIRKLLGQPSAINLKLLFGNNPLARPTYDKVNPITHANLTFLPHIRDVLNGLELSKGIVTSKRLDHALDVLQDLRQFFSVIITPEQTTRQKPNPEPLLLACEKLGVSVRKSVYVGDTVRDYQTAQNAGAAFIGFVHDGATSEEFHNAGATNTVTELSDLPEIVKRLSP